jgi:hypothetical protein
MKKHWVDERDEIVTWALNYKTLTKAWNDCIRGDWMFWLCCLMCGKDGWPTRQELVLAACACAETAPKYVRKPEIHTLQIEAARRAIETARKWANGEATIAAVNAAADDAYIAHAYAAAAAAYSASYPNDAVAAAMYIADAADVYYAAAADAYAARAIALKELAVIIRPMLRIPEAKESTK